MMSPTKIFLIASLVTCLAIFAHLLQYIPFDSRLPVLVGGARFAAAVGAFIGTFTLLSFVRLVVTSRINQTGVVTASSVAMAFVAIAMTVASLGNRVSDGLLQLYAM